MLFHGLNRLTLSLFAAWYWAAVNFFSYILSIAIAVLILLWPTIGFVKSRSGDPIFSPVAGSTASRVDIYTLLIGLLIAMLAYIAIAVRASGVVRRLFEGRIHRSGFMYTGG